MLIERLNTNVEDLWGIHSIAFPKNLLQLRFKIVDSKIKVPALNGRLNPS